MREKISKLANEEFEYELPEVTIATDCLSVRVEKNEKATETFRISNRDNQVMKCFLVCNCPYISLSTESFVGNDVEVSVSVLVKDQEAGHIIEDKIIILSDCGERILPLEIEVVNNYYNTSMGEIKDLFHFANLAKTSQEEAVSLFKSPEFERVFLHSKSELLLYRSLVKGNSSKQAMEEFLVAIHKKLKLLFSIPKTEVFYDIEAETSFIDKLLIKKDNWGYSELKISSDAAFLIPEHKRVWSNDFTANRYELEYVIEPKLMRNGKNFAKLVIESAHQKFEVTVTAWKKSQEQKERNNYLRKKEWVLKFFQNYINFRINHIAKDIYILEIEELLKKGIHFIDKEVLLLINYHANIIKSEINELRKLADEIKEKEKVWEKEDREKYCAVLYLRALQTKKEEDILKATEKISEYYEQEEKFIYLWYLLYLDSSYKEKKVREQALLRQLELGVHSPILYYELITYYNQYPTALNDLTEKIIAVFHWGVKYQCIHWDFMLQYVLLVRRNKGFHSLIYRDLVILYEKYEADEILSAICRFLIRNEKAGNEYFKWYQLGVDKHLRITNLYEYYLYSCDEKKITELPPSLLLYFNYDSNLSNRKKAFLYAYIIKNKIKHRAIYEQYQKKILHFTKAHLDKKSQDENMSVLYEEMMENGTCSIELAQRVTEVMFQYELVCENLNMQGVIVSHKEIKEEVYTPLVDGKAIISIFTEQPCIIFVDHSGGRYGKTVPYTLHKLNGLERYEKICYEFGSQNPMILLNLFEKIEQYQKLEKDTEKICREVAKIDSLTSGYRGNVWMKLLERYYETMDSNGLKEVLDSIHFSDLSREDRAKVIEICIIYDRENKALTGLKEYGLNGIRTNRLIRLVTKWIRERKDDKDEFILTIAWYTFLKGKYNEEILTYLVKYGKGASGDLFLLWEKASAFEVDTEALEERLLYQVLFTEHCSQKYFKVFLSYYKRGKNPLLIHAFLCFHAYRYIVHDRVLNEQLFQLLEKECQNRESQSICLSLLKHYSTFDVLPEQKNRFVQYMMYRMIEKGIVLPFFREFKGKVVIPYEIQDKYYVEYKCNPKKRVVINYRLDENTTDEFTSEAMKPVYNGIFVKDFVLFYNESIQYYIVEEEKEDSSTDIQRQITESVNVILNNIAEEKEITSYNMINDMLMAREMQDEKTLLELMKNYVQSNYTGCNVFKPL